MPSPIHPQGMTNGVSMKDAMRFPTSTPRNIPVNPPICPIMMTSTKNWVRMAFGEAPKAFRVPISRVLSETLTNMMFISPMPAPNKVMIPMNEAASVMPWVASFNVETKPLLIAMRKEESSPGRSPRITLNIPVEVSASGIKSSAFST